VDVYAFRKTSKNGTKNFKEQLTGLESTRLRPILPFELKTENMTAAADPVFRSLGGDNFLGMSHNVLDLQPLMAPRVSSTSRPRS
jgi:hypothetical protein